MTGDGKAGELVFTKSLDPNAFPDNYEVVIRGDKEWVDTVLRPLTEKAIQHDTVATLLHETQQAANEYLKQVKDSRQREERIVSALESLETDNHYWSTRPCDTCASISKMMGRPFGCVKKAQSVKKEAGR